MDDSTESPFKQGSASRSHKTLVAQAIIDDDTQTLDELLRTGADVNEFSYLRGQAESPLLTAVRYAREDIVPRLLSHGVDVNAASSRGHTPLLRAAQRDYLPMMCQLLRHKADPNIVDRNGRTALFWAVKLRNFTAAKELIRCGADVNLSSDSTSIIHTAVSVDNTDITRLLLDEGADVNVRDEFDETPLFAAIRVDNLDIVRLLLDRGCDVNTVNLDLRTPLHLSAASVHNNIDLTRLLLDKGAYVNALDRYMNTPLVLRLRNYILRPNYSVAKCLIQYGSSLRDDNCASALEWTIEAHGNFDVVKFAIEAGFPFRGVSWVQDLLLGDPNRRRWFTTGYNTNQEKVFVEFLRDRWSNPQSLMLLCRIAIRDLLIYSGRSSNVHVGIKALPIPQVTKLFLMMEDN